MKNVAIIYNDAKNSSAIEYVEGVIKDIFVGYINIEHYFLDQLDKNQLIIADAVLLHGEKLLYHVQPHLAEMDNLIVLSRSISEKHLSEIMCIPKDTDVLVVNDTFDSTMDVLYTLYGLGVHFNLIPYEEESHEKGAYRQIEYAITPGEPHIVPEYIKNVIDIGYRKLSFDPLLKLMHLLDLNNETVNNNLISYLHTVIEPNMASHTNYLESYIKNLILNELFSESGFSILAYDNQGRLLFQNDNASKTFASVEMPDMSGDAVKNQPVTINDANYLMDRITIDSAEQHLGYIISLRDEKNIRESGTHLNKVLKEKGIYARYHFEDIICNTPIMENCISTAKQAALTDYTILLRGESGTGKEMFAQSIHNYSQRKNNPFIAINCSALSESLLESELFGYEAGAFTGAKKNGKMGLFEQANTGTVFLDEIGDISAGLQTRLLRVLQEKQIMRIGGDRVIDIDVRVIAATNRNLKAMVEEGTFRKDLFYRLCVIPLDIPPLRRRKTEILPLFMSFVGSDFKKLSDMQIQKLNAYDWPGNVRELENAATYFKTLYRLPPIPDENIADTAESLHAGDIDIKKYILKFLYERAKSCRGAGRPDIQQYLRSLGLMIGDSRLRTVLKELQASELISIEKGRSGTHITEKGINDISR
ncbi:MAG: sigma 54-interacting transcriptional regulator [Anaerovoracaceae bacterium]|nr:sigma 54-interacting transcriptional regulator [Anaerovoracaceae bacterium]